MYVLIIMLGMALGAPQDKSQDMYFNHLNISLGINYKYNGLLYHNIDRVWVITKVILPKLEDISFPDVKFDADCSFVDKIHNAQRPVKTIIQSMCKSMKPLITLIKQKESYYEMAIKSILKEEIPRSLRGTRNSQVGSPNQDPVSAGRRFSRSTKGEITVLPVRRKKAIGAFVPALASLAKIAVESLSSFLQRKRNKAMSKGLTAIGSDQSLTWNSLKQLEKDFLLYGKFNVAKLHDIVRTVNGIRNRTLSLEKLLTGQDLRTLQHAHMAPGLPGIEGRLTFMHKTNLYVHSVLERQIRLYVVMLHHLKDLLDSIGILSTGKLPPMLFPPTVLENITLNAIDMVRRTHPEYELAVGHVTEYYDMTLGTFGVDTGDNMVVAFPIFVKDRSDKPKTLYELETVKVPIPDQNPDANSYSEVQYSKPYIAVNDNFYIQLRIQELRMCKMIRHVYYCEELFLIKHRTHPTCESAIFYKASPTTVYSVCTFRYFYNTTVQPSILDGGNHILLANQKAAKSLICSHNHNLPTPLAQFPYVMVNRSLLCHCRLQSGTTHLAKSLASCKDATNLKLYFTINAAFNHFMAASALPHSRIDPNQLLPERYIFDIFLNASAPSIFYNNTDIILPLDPPDTLSLLFQSFNTRHLPTKNLPFSPIERHTKIKKSTKVSFLVSTIAHIIYLTTTCVVVALIAPQVYLACKHKKLRTLVAALTLQRIPSTQALSAFEIPGNKEAKFICQDPWVSITVTIITIVTILVYLYKACSKMTFFRGYLLDSACTVYMFLSHDSYHVPVKLRGANGPFYTFVLTGQLRAQNVELIKHILWDTLNVKWINTTLNASGKRIDLPESITIPLWDKMKVRTIMAHTNARFNLMIKQDNTWYAPRTETKSIEAIKSQEEV